MELSDTGGRQTCTALAVDHDRVGAEPARRVIARTTHVVQNGRDGKLSLYETAL